MSELRSTTLKEIEQALDRSYFAGGSFKVKNQPEKSPFLTITFLPQVSFSFSVSQEKNTALVGPSSLSNLCVFRRT